MDVLETVETSEWASPIVVVPKANGQIRICGDFRVGLNSQLHVERYPIPSMHELLIKLKEMNIFSRLDYSDAYFQLPTPFGLYRYKRLSFGVSSAPAIFQRYIESILMQIPNCPTFLEDIIVIGASMTVHLKTLELVLAKLQENELSCKIQKCEFYKTEIAYLGQVL
ncbi:Retrovirus-related Pol polyprotein from transposon 17.6 [Thelohanellus kitauei]|uniref:Retrovirus-related Pol polyprotein from transposon 17.6 n=1 Tax=Thelohanellus kitauei TaxID=669202 RepID=A0A0C2J478_THEKT|nr:Retrovirus-related Pol polyprotein from transposon 17.6 [Thelohanellus kitauei]